MAKKQNKPSKKSAEVAKKESSKAKVIIKKPVSKFDFKAKITNPEILASLFAEFIGTFIFAAGILSLNTLLGFVQSLDILVTTIFSGLILGVVVLTVGKVSGAFVNPALTIGAFATKRLSLVRALGYIVAQIIGGMLAFVVVNYFLSQSSQEFPIATATAIKDNLLPIFLAECLGMFIFAFSVAQVTASKQTTQGVVAAGVGGGLSVALLIAVLWQLFGAKVVLNPAIALSLQAFTVEGTDIASAMAVFIGAPILGAVIAFFASEILTKFSKK